MEPQERHATKLDRVLENEEQREQDRHREKRWQTASQSSKWTHTSVVIDLHYRFTLLYWILVLLLSGGELRLQLLHSETRAHSTLIEGPECKPHKDSKNDQHPPIAQIEPVVHPEESLNHLRGDWMHHPLKKTPAVGIHMIEVPSHSHETL